jgi:hypothetical protein
MSLNINKFYKYITDVFEARETNPIFEVDIHFVNTHNLY